MTRPATPETYPAMKSLRLSADGYPAIYCEQHTHFLVTVSGNLTDRRSREQSKDHGQANMTKGH